MNPDYDKLANEIAAAALALHIANVESGLDYRLLRFALIAIATTAFILSGWDTSSIVASTLAAVEFTMCVRMMLALNWMRREFDKISRV